MDITDSPEGPECVICMKKLNDYPYAVINKKGESGIYHVECLEQWLNKSHNRGVLQEEETELYSIYHNDQLIESINTIKKVNDMGEVPDIPEIIIIPMNENSESEIFLNNTDNQNNENYCNASRRTMFICGLIALFILTCILVLHYFSSK
jgi:hypothetical protein